MKRRLFNLLFSLLAAVSLLLLVAAGALWVRGRFALDVVVSHVGVRRSSVPDDVGRGTSVLGSRQVIVRNYRDAVYVSWMRMGVRGGKALLAHESAPPMTLGVAALPGVKVKRVGGFKGALFVRHWVLLVACAPVPAAAAVRMARAARRGRRRRGGCCARCGYDLRATPGRCPECGAGLPAADARDRSGPLIPTRRPRLDRDKGPDNRDNAPPPGG